MGKGMPSNETIAGFYDGFGQQLLDDYVKGNPRVEAAIESVEAHLRSGVSRVLDIGCGIGASSYSFRAGRAWLTVHGVDISPKNIEIARRLFAHAGMEFTASDMSQVPSGEPYDLIAMLDVYEHIPREKWPGFHRVLGKTLAGDGTIVLTTPTFLHQDHLAKHCPEGLQVVDETVTIEDVTRLASDVGATVTRFEMQSIWHTNDYVHAVLERSPQYRSVGKRRSLLRRLDGLHRWPERAQRTARRRRVEELRAKS